MQHPRHVLLVLPTLQHDPDHHLHGLRREDAQDPGELQRVEIHRFHNVHDLHHLAGFHTDLLWHRKLAHLRGECTRPNVRDEFRAARIANFPVIKGGGLWPRGGGSYEKFAP